MSRAFASSTATGSLNGDMADQVRIATDTGNGDRDDDSEGQTGPRESGLDAALKSGCRDQLRRRRFARRQRRSERIAAG